MLYLRRRSRPSAAGAALALAFAIVLVLAIACNGSSSNGADAPGGNTPSPESTGTPAATESTPDATASPTAPPEPLTLEQLAARSIAGVDGKVTYRYISNLGFKPDGVWTTYRLSGDSRQDWQPQEFESTTTVIVAGGETYVCTQTTGPTSCTRDDDTIPRTLAALFTSVTEVVEAILADIPELESAELPDETIAGVEAQCFDLTLPDREEIKICFSPDGLLLWMQRTVLYDNPDVPTGELSLEAQEAGDASAADFEPLTPVE